MEESLKKKKNTTGPFAVPLGEVVGRSKINFLEYNAFLHSEKFECCQWKVEDRKHLVTDQKSSLNINGPFSKKDYAVYYTCQKNKCELRCLCSLCDNLPCSRTSCQTESFCSKCNPQCQDHFVGVQRDFDPNLHFISSKMKYPGILKNCDECSRDLRQHNTYHSVIHQRCRFCQPTSIKLNDAISLNACEENERKYHSLEKRTCKSCFKLFTRPDLRKRHEDSNSCQNNDPKLKRKPGKYNCDICDKDFKDNCSLNRHTKIHQEDFQLVKCDLCQKSFMNTQNKERHLTLVHNILEYNKNPYFPICKDARQFACGICHEKFKTKFHCNRHEETTHNKQTSVQFQCKFCSENFSRKDNADRHSNYSCTLRSSEIVPLIMAELIENI